MKQDCLKKRSELVESAKNALVPLLEHTGLSRRAAQHKALLFILQARADVESSVDSIGFK